MTLFDLLLLITAVVVLSLAMGNLLRSLFWRWDRAMGRQRTDGGCSCPDAMHYRADCPRHGWPRPADDDTGADDNTGDFEDADEAAASTPMPDRPSRLDATSTDDLLRHYEALIDETKAEDAS